MNSCAKGKRGEREARDVWREEGFTCRRTQQYCGNSGDATDLVIEEAPSLHVENKRCERGNPYDWLEQAERDCKDGRLPVVQHRRNYHETIFILPRKTFFRLLRGSDLIAMSKLNATVPATGEAVLPPVTDSVNENWICYECAASIVNSGGSPLINIWGANQTPHKQGICGKCGKQDTLCQYPRCYWRKV